MNISVNLLLGSEPVSEPWSENRVNSEPPPTVSATVKENTSAQGGAPHGPQLHNPALPGPHADLPRDDRPEPGGAREAGGPVAKN